jgi:hypothetical protein
MVSPEAARRAAVGMALDDVGLAPLGDEEVVEIFLAALKDHGYIIIREANGVFPGTRKE